MTFGEKIKELRKEKNLTIKELSSKSGISTVTINNYELGKSNPSLLSIQKLSKALKCDFNVLYNLK